MLGIGMQLGTRILFFSLVFLALPALADDDEDAPVRFLKVRSRQRVERRNLASLGEPEAFTPYADLQAGGISSPSDSDVRIRLGLLSGVTFASTGSGGDDDYRINYDLYFGATADVRLYRYFGLEAEGYYGAGSVQKLSDGFLTDATDQFASLSHYGMLFNLAARYPFRTETVTWAPKVGVGFGMQQLTLSQDFDFRARDGGGNLARFTADEEVRGPFALIGLEIEPWPFLVLGGDFAFSFGAGSSVRFTGELLGLKVPINVTLDPSSFTRLRLSAFFRVAKGLMLGAQYVERNLNLDFPALPFGLLDGIFDVLQPKQRHVLGVLAYEF